LNGGSHISGLSRWLEQAGAKQELGLALHGTATQIPEPQLKLGRDLRAAVFSTTREARHNTRRMGLAPAWPLATRTVPLHR
jgi:hypothetical protein